MIGLFFGTINLMRLREVSKSKTIELVFGTSIIFLPKLTRLVFGIMGTRVAISILIYLNTVAFSIGRTRLLTEQSDSMN